MAESKAFSGARGRVLFNGKVVGFVQNVSGNKNYQLARMDCLGKLESEDIVPVGVTADGRIGLFHVRTRDLVSEGIVPGSRSEDVLNTQLFDVQIVDVADDNKVVLTLVGVRIETVGFDMQSRGLTMRGVGFQGVNVREASE
jgi:hypothetical protein